MIFIFVEGGDGSWNLVEKKRNKWSDVGIKILFLITNWLKI